MSSYRGSDTDPESPGRPQGPRTPDGEHGGTEAVKPLSGSDTEALLAAAIHEAYPAALHTSDEAAKAILATPSGQRLLAPTERAPESEATPNGDRDWPTIAKWWQAEAWRLAQEAEAPTERERALVEVCQRVLARHDTHHPQATAALVDWDDMNAMRAALAAQPDAPEAAS